MEEQMLIVPAWWEQPDSTEDDLTDLTEGNLTLIPYRYEVEK